MPDKGRSSLDASEDRRTGMEHNHIETRESFGDVGSPDGSLFRFVAETGSTNDDLKALALDDAPEGLWLRAGYQTAGRGRMGRHWQGADGNLYASTLVRLRAADPIAPTLALVAAVAVQDALSHCLRDVGCDQDRSVSIKWPNDIMVGKAKLCGMLLERAGDAVIVGIGVNVASAPLLADRETLCLDDLAMVRLDLAEVLSRIAAYFSHWLAIWRNSGLEPVVAAWEERAHPPGTPLAVQEADGRRTEGRFVALNRDGGLRLRLTDGSERVIHAGDVFLI